MGDGHEGQKNQDRDEHLTVYREYNQALRTWFLTYAVGLGATLIARHADAGAPPPATVRGWSVVVWLALAVAFQVAGTGLNKYLNLYAYAKRAAGQPLHSKLDSMLHAWWIDLALDVATAVFLFCGTWGVVEAVGG